MYINFQWTLIVGNQNFNLQNNPNTHEIQVGSIKKPKILKFKFEQHDLYYYFGTFQGTANSQDLECHLKSLVLCKVELLMLNSQSTCTYNMYI